MLKIGNDEHNTEDKKYWIDKYTEKEFEFVKKMCDDIGMHTIINPDKKTDKYAPDILVRGVLSDLKYVGTPFYTSKKYYGIDPQHAVTFDDKDYIRYREKYPNIHIYFWVKYPAISGMFGGIRISLDPMDHVFHISFKDLRKMIEEKKVHHHLYKRREGDNSGNSRGCYVLDVRTMSHLE
jgi:hypothetical protein